MKKSKIIVIGLIALASFACNRNPKSGVTDETPTRGKIRIGVDETFYILSEAELYTFQSIYDYASITPQYKPEGQIWEDFMNDSVQTIIAAKKLSKNEEEYFSSKNLFPRTVLISYDGIAFIVNKANKDSLIRYNQIRDIFLGKINNWNQINPKSNLGRLRVVFDNNKSSTVRYISEKFKIEGSMPKNCYAVERNEEVVNFVKDNKDAIGVVGVNWVSDKDDSITRGFMKQIKVAAISSEYDSDGNEFYKPYQAFIADKSYPFIREIYMICRETYTGLGSGYMQFVAGEKGQRIILKNGMVPATMPIRLVKTRSNF